MSESNKKSKGKFGEWFKGLKAEFNKIIWPEKSSVIRQTITVAIITAILGVIIVLLDKGFIYVLDQIKTV